MKVYICKVWDGDLGDTVVIGAFSSLAKAFEAGGLYISEESGGTAELLDWDETAPVYSHWYQDHWGVAFTREVTETELDERLA
jgi:hypothetical protein